MFAIGLKDVSKASTNVARGLNVDIRGMPRGAAVPREPPLRACIGENPQIAVSKQQDRAGTYDLMHTTVLPLHGGQEGAAPGKKQNKRSAAHFIRAAGVAPGMMVRTGAGRTRSIQLVSCQFLALIRYRIQKRSRFSIEKFDIRRKSATG